MATLATGNNQMQQGLGNISVENSKFLGGDLQHTHLVKGLDYALLQKVVVFSLLLLELDASSKITRPQGCCHSTIDTSSLSCEGS